MRAMCPFCGQDVVSNQLGSPASGDVLVVGDTHADIKLGFQSIRVSSEWRLREGDNGEGDNGKGVSNQLGSPASGD